MDCVGIVADELSTTALAMNLPVVGSEPLARLLAIARECGEPVVLTLRQLTRQTVAFASAPVFVCENPAVVLAAANARGAECPPLVCVNGQPTAAVLRLLTTLTDAGCALRYHGDFDWGGLRIANLLWSRFPYNHGGTTPGPISTTCLGRRALCGAHRRRRRGIPTSGPRSPATGFGSRRRPSWTTSSPTSSDIRDLSVPSLTIRPQRLQPPVPPNLGTLTGGQSSFVDFIRLDRDLLAAAGAGSSRQGEVSPAKTEWAGWVRALPAAEKDALIVTVMQGPSLCWAHIDAPLPGHRQSSPGPVGAPDGRPAARGGRVEAESERSTTVRLVGT